MRLLGTVSIDQVRLLANDPQADLAEDIPVMYRIFSSVYHMRFCEKHLIELEPYIFKIIYHETDEYLLDCALRYPLIDTVGALIRWEIGKGKPLMPSEKPMQRDTRFATKLSVLG